MIEVKSVSKSYGTTRALDQVSFSVENDQILGFLGPNGAGKSTAMKIITTFLSPDSGSVEVDGVDGSKDPLAIRKRIGYLPETAPLYGDMRTKSYVEFVARARGLSGADLDRRLDWVHNACNITDVLYKPINALSKGYRQRVGLAQALVHDPDILILDEPTSGLDPGQIIDIRNLISELAASKTIIFSSHVLAEINAVTNRVVIINEGKMVADDNIDQLRQKAITDNRLRVATNASDDDTRSALQRLAGAREIVAETGGNGRSTFVVASDPTRDLRGDIMRLARENQWDLLELHAEQPSLEEVFIHYTRREVAS